jgi:hypothetical protein
MATNHIVASKEAGWQCPYCEEAFRAGQPAFIDRETTEQIYCTKQCRDADASRVGDLITD